MKKITLMLLVAMVPFLTMAQKRTKKNKETKTETTDRSSAVASNFMIIKGCTKNSIIAVFLQHVRR